MLPAQLDLVWAVLSVLLYGLAAILAVGLVVGVPIAFAKVVYDRAVTDDVSNPVALGFAVAFFAALVGLFVVGTMLVWYG